MENVGAEGLLVWNEETGVGYYPVTSASDGVYNEAYWEEYVKRSGTLMGASLTAARIALVDKYIGRGPLVDVGVGAGQFVEARQAWGQTYGYDVNPVAVRWLVERGLWWDPFWRKPNNVSLFDSLEHMEDPAAFLRRVDGFVFCSIPIFRDKAHVLRSKHFKPMEHYWFFTRNGLIRWFEDIGFSLLEENEMETELGREDIGTYVFKRLI